MADELNREGIPDVDQPDVLAAEMELYAERGVAPDVQVLRHWAQATRANANG